MTVELVLLPRVSYRGTDVVGPRLQHLLALLAGDLRAGRSTDRLIDELWPDDQPEHPTKALQALVFRARAQLGPDLLVSTPRGYRLALTEDQVDASAVLRRASDAEREARKGAHLGALEAADAGLALFGETPEATGPLGELRRQRDVTRLALRRARALALARLERWADAIGPLTELAAAAPRDEELLTELLRAEAATKGPAAALTRYDAYRRTLRDELGADPGAELQAAYQELLRPIAPISHHGIPYDPNPLLGRDRDLAAVTGLVRASRVTSIVGLGGLGKTRLAQAVAREAGHRSVFFVPLAGVVTDGDVVGEVATALGLGGRDTAEDALKPIVDTLGGALLVLDNCEQVVRGVADLVHDLVSRSRDLRILVTSRTPLGLSSESVYPLGPLSRHVAEELFRQRATAVRPGADLPADVVRSICEHLDGLPLAVELAAARVRMLSVHEISRRLGERFTLLRGGARDAPERHRTLSAVIDWSWHLLTPDGQAAMRTLSVFPGGFTADAAEYLGIGEDTLEHLADQSLLQVIDTDGGVRFRMLETVREFSALRRAGAGETEQANDRFLDWARYFGRTHHRALFGPDFVARVRLVRSEQDNLATALRLAVERSDGATVAATTAALAGWWLVESNFSRLATLSEDPAWTLSHYRPTDAADIETTRSAAVLTMIVGLLLWPHRSGRSLLVLRRLPPTRPDDLIGASDTVLRSAGLDAVREFRNSAEPLLAAIADTVLSYAAENAGDADEALAAAERVLDALAEQQDGAGRWLGAAAHSRVGELLLNVGRLDAARLHFAAVLSVLDDLGAWPSATRVRWALVFACLQEGDVAGAEKWLSEIEFYDPDDLFGVPGVAAGVRAEILLARGDVDAGLAQWREAVARLRDPLVLSMAGMSAWAIDMRATAVIAHALAGRPELFPAADLESVLADFPLPSLPTCGSALIALAATDIVRHGRAAAQTSAALLALGEQCGVGNIFLGDSTIDRIRALIGDVPVQPVDRDALPAAVAAALRARAPLSEPSPSGTKPATTGNRRA